MKKITIATFNVHHWADANHFDNYDRVLKLCKVKNSPSQIDLILKLLKKKHFQEYNPDIICLQESSRPINKRLSADMGYNKENTLHSWNNCDILSKFPCKLFE